MKLFFVTILAVFIFSGFAYKNKFEEKPQLSCVLTADKAVYKIGEVPKLEVKITNNCGNDIYLIGSLDNSALKGRMPYCYYNIEKPVPDTFFFGFCGTANPLRAEDFKIVKSGEVFNPYENIDSYGYFPDYASTQKETFRNTGVYKIQFHYSTNDTAIWRFRGTVNENWVKHNDTALINKMFAKVPKIELSSNTIEIEVRE